MIHSRPGGVCGVMYALAMEPLRLSGGAQMRFGGAPVSSPSSMSDRVAAIARSGDRAAFEALFLHFAPRVKAYLMRMGTSPEAAEELAQETLLALWRRAAWYVSPRFRPSRTDWRRRSWARSPLTWRAAMSTT